MGYQTALPWAQRPQFFVCQDRKLKFGIHVVHTKWSTIIYICVGSLPSGPQNGRCLGPWAALFAYSKSKLTYHFVAVLVAKKSEEGRKRLLPVDQR